MRWNTVRRVAFAGLLAVVVTGPGPAPLTIEAEAQERTVRVSVNRMEARAVDGPGGRPIVFHRVPGDSASATALAAVAREFVPPPVAALGLPPDSFDVVVAPTEAAFQELTGGRVPDWGLAVAFPGLRRIVIRSLRMTGSSGVDPATVLRHELGHLYLAAAAGPGGGAIPRWFNEGFSAFYADEWRWVAPWRLAWARITRRLEPLDELDATFPEVPTPELAYIQSMAAVRSLEERGGDRGIALLLARIRSGASFDQALRDTYGMTEAQFYADWESEMGREYGWLTALSDERGLWVGMAIVVAVVWFWRRRSIKREIDRRKRVEDAALGPPDDPELGVEEHERYWEWEDDTWRREDRDAE